MTNLTKNSQDPMTQSTKGLTDAVRRASINWVLAMQKAYGQETGMKCFDVMRETFGDELCGAVMFGILEGRRGDQIVIKSKTADLTRKIEAIKEVRHISGMGLKEAKDAVEKSVWDEVVIPLSYDMMKESNQHILDNAIANLDRCGVTVF